MRFEHISIHENHVGKPQMYMECAQVKVVGNGGGKPGPMVKIPGLLNKNSPQLSTNILLRSLTLCRLRLSGREVLVLMLALAPLAVPIQLRPGAVPVAGLGVQAKGSIT